MSDTAATDTRAERGVLEHYGRMLLIRLFEGEIHRLFLRGEVHGTTHLYAGQEAVAVGVCSALQPGDWIAGTYRGHGHALAAGTDPERLVAEMLGRATGVCGGRAGSMNVADLEHGLVGCFGIVGGSIGAATGAAHVGEPHRQRRGRLLRRRRHEPGLLPRVPELRPGGEPAGRLRLREQLLRRVHADAEGHRRGRHRRARGRVRDAGPRSSTATTCGRSARPRARRSSAPAAATARRCSRPRPTATTATRSPTPRRTGRRRRSSAGWSATRSRSPAPGCSSSGIGEEDIEATEREVRATLDRAVEAALAAPYPDPEADAATEFAA